MTNEQLIQEIKQLIGLLQQELTGLKENSSAFRGTSSAIEGYTAAIAKLTGQAKSAAGELATLETQLNKVAAAAKKPPEQRQAQYSLATLPGSTGRSRSMFPRAPLSNESEWGPALSSVAIHEGNANLPTVRTSTTAADKRLADQAAKEAARATKKAAEAEKRAAEKVQKAAEEEVARVERNRNIGTSMSGGFNAQNNLYKVASKYDKRFGPETLQRVQEEPTTGISRATFSYKTDEGIIRQATFNVDKFGKVLVDTQKRFRSFTSGIIRDTAEVLKWSIAVGAIYMPMQKFGELLQAMVQNETALAAVTVTLGNAQKSTNEIFQASYQIAQAVGEEQNKVLEAYNSAYRATGGIADVTERFNTANKLLTDSLTLSKLGTLSEAEAIDTLSAALKQVAKPGEDLQTTLSRGSELLNKWVAVSKVANVDLDTLATGFSVVGDAADAAGIGTDKLNAVLATIAETSSVSGREVANTARAFVSGFESDQAQKAIQSYGISLTKASGEAKNFLEISQEIANLKQKGLISTDQFAGLANQIGGGARRGASVATFIENLGKIQTVETASSKATADTGEAMDAMGKKLDTVQTATTRLGNAFQDLAQSLGDSGGLLDLTKGFLNVLNGIVEALSNVTNLAGKAGPALAVVAASWAIINAQGPGFKSSAQNGIKAFGSNFISNAGSGPLTNKWLGSNKTGSRFDTATGFGDFLSGQRMIQAGAFKTNVLGIGAGALAVGAAAGQNFSQGKNSQGVANLAGGIVGGIAGSLAGPAGTAIGASLGSSIAEGFVNSAENYKPQFEQLFSEVFTTSKAKAGETPQQTAEQAAISKLQSASGNVGITGAMRTTAFNAVGAGSTFISNTLSSILPKVFGKKNDKFSGYTDAQSAAISLGIKKALGQISQQDYDETMALLQSASAPRAKAEAESKATQNKLAPVIDAAQSKAQASLLKDFGAGKVGTAAYRRGTEQLGGLGATGSRFYNAFGNGMGMGEQGFFNMSATVSARTSPEELAPLNEYSQIIEEQNAIIADGTKTTKEHQNAIEQRNETVKAATKYMGDLNTKIQSQAQLLGQVDLTAYDKGDAQKIVANAQKRTQQMLQEQVDNGVISPEEMQAKLDVLAELIVEWSDQTTGKIKGTTEADINASIEKMKDAGELIDKQKGMGFQTFDVSSGELQGLLKPGGKYEQKLKQFTEAGYKPTLEDQVAVTNEGNVTPIYKKDWKVVQYLLQEILDTEQKQLDGMYNLPEGSSFWIPAQAALLHPKDNGTSTTDMPNVHGNGATTETKSYEDSWRKFKDAETATWSKASSIMNDKAYQDSWRKFKDADSAWSAPTTKAGAGEPKNPNLYETPPAKIPFDPSFNLLDFIKGLLGGGASGIQTKPQSGGGLGADFNSLMQGIQNLTTKLTLNINNTTSVQLDGRQIAAVVKDYLKDDLLRFANGATQKSVNVI